MFTIYSFCISSDPPGETDVFFVLKQDLFNVSVEFTKVYPVPTCAFIVGVSLLFKINQSSWLWFSRKCNNSNVQKSLLKASMMSFFRSTNYKSTLKPTKSKSSKYTVTVRNQIYLVRFGERRDGVELATIRTYLTPFWYSINVNQLMITSIRMCFYFLRNDFVSIFFISIYRKILNLKTWR